MQTLYFLIGPTASGKTALAVDWALRNGAHILCADSPLVYKGMDIGTAKPTLAEQKRVPHHGIDLVDCSSRFSVGDYAVYAQQTIEKLLREDKKVLIVGGSGFYLKSFFKSPTDDIPIADDITLKVERAFKESGLRSLLDALRQAGGDDLTGLDEKNPRRVMKALERVWSSGRSFRELKTLYENKEPPYPNIKKRVVMISRPREELHSRIRERAVSMLKNGLIEEVESLIKMGLRENPQTRGVIGYRETLRYLDGQINKQELLEEIVKDTGALVRKQCTFFKQLPVNDIISDQVNASDMGKLYV